MKQGERPTTTRAIHFLALRTGSGTGEIRVTRNCHVALGRGDTDRAKPTLGDVFYHAHVNKYRGGQRCLHLSSSHDPRLLAQLGKASRNCNYNLELQPLGVDSNSSSSGLPNSPPGWPVVKRACNLQFALVTHVGGGKPDKCFNYGLFYICNLSDATKKAPNYPAPPYPEAINSCKLLLLCPLIRLNDLLNANNNGKVKGKRKEIYSTYLLLPITDVLNGGDMYVCM